MALAQPKPDSRLKDACARLRNNADFRLLLEYNKAQLAHAQERLMTASVEALGQLQGRALQITDLIELIETKKE